MDFRVIQPGSSSLRALVVLYKVGPGVDGSLDAAIREALGPGPCVVAYAGADGKPLEQTIARAGEAAAVLTFCAVVLCGWSAGCLRGVRQRLRDGAEPCAVVAIDGCHADLPPTQEQIDVWREYVAGAVRGERLFVATCSQQTYVEEFHGAERYMSTVSTLERVTGWALRPGGPLNAPTERHEGECHVYSYASAAIDGPAHSAQLTTVLPEMLRRHLRPWLTRFIGCPDLSEGDRPTPPPDTSPEPTEVPPPTLGIAAEPPLWQRSLRRGSRGDDVRAWQERLLELGYDPGTPDGDFGPVTDHATREFQGAAGIHVDGIVGPKTRSAAADAESPPSPWQQAPDLPSLVLAAAEQDVRDGKGEVPPRSNDGPYVRGLFEGTGVEPPAPYCAAALRDWIARAARALDMAPPIQGSVGAKATMRQFQRAGRWHDAVPLREGRVAIRPGMVPVWHRGPAGADTGHTGVLSRVDGKVFWSIEANAGDQVGEYVHSLDDPRLLGMGRLDGP